MTKEKGKMTVQEAIENRRSIRRYKDDPVDEGAILELLEAARLAPSSSNSQPWRFMVIKDPQQRSTVAGYCGNQRQVKEAPVLIICCGDKSRYSDENRGSRTVELAEAGIFEDIGLDAVEWIDSFSQKRRAQSASLIPLIQANVAIAVTHITLKAYSLGLGTCWIGAFEHGKLHQFLELPDHIFIAAILTLGYPAQNPRARPRLPLSEILLPVPGERS